jgi:hypothetical protein
MLTRATHVGPVRFCPWQAPEKVLDKRVGRAGPVWRHAFVRFTENKVVRNSFLSDILADSETEREAIADFS